MRHFARYIPLVALTAASGAQADMVAHFDMEAVSGEITETISGSRFAVEGNFAPENVEGAVGNALRFDGYTSRVEAALGDIFPSGAAKMTVSMWAALPCYPVIEIDRDTKEQTPLVSCLDEEAKTGFGFFLGFNGGYSFRMYVGGWPVVIEADSPLPPYQWNHLVAVVDCDARTATLYNNGVQVGSGKANGNISFSPSALYMGQGRESRKSGPFELMSFNGLIDDISIWDEALSPSDFADVVPENDPSLDIPSSRFASDRLRPRFHGMPAAGWTNECHGLIYSDGRYHLLFQKNGDGPYMARLHWGHISSDNLYDWREEKIALAPGDWYDIKGCWSGCVFSDDEVTGGRPGILYTAVDYAKAMIAQASAESDSLVNWSKASSNPVISGRPSGLSDDFRDPYFFRDGDRAYMIVGTSKDGVGAATLHRYDPVSKRWSNSGDIFFSGTSAAQDGTFWEMPNVTRMPDGKWLFTATPLNTRVGVRTLYWTGSIDDGGHFLPDAQSAAPRLVELESREGFGMLSPTVYAHDGKVLALGIVPDKLPSLTNWSLGWAHCYSLPREWSLSAGGELVQKPYEGLKGLRTKTLFSREDFTLDGSLDLDPVRGDAVEVCGEFEAGNGSFGFELFRGGGGCARIFYSPASGEIVADFSSLPRIPNDGGIYDGVYRCALPVRPDAGSVVKLNVFLDHSILDIFVNDRWATSVRVFPTDAAGVDVAAFSEGEVKVGSLRAWILDVEASGSSVEEVDMAGSGPAPSCLYDMSGRSFPRDMTESLNPGIYVGNGGKILVR